MAALTIHLNGHDSIVLTGNTHSALNIQTGAIFHLLLPVRDRINIFRNEDKFVS